MWKRLRRKEPAAAKGGSSKQKEETKEAEAEAVGTPSTAPLGFDEEEEVANAGVPRTSSHGSQGSEYFDAQELYADNFKLKRERVRLLEDLRCAQLNVCGCGYSADLRANEIAHPTSFPTAPSPDNKQQEAVSGGAAGRAAGGDRGGWVGVM